MNLLSYHVDQSQHSEPLPGRPRKWDVLRDGVVIGHVLIFPASYRLDSDLVRRYVGLCTQRHWVWKRDRFHKLGRVLEQLQRMESARDRARGRA